MSVTDQLIYDTARVSMTSKEIYWSVYTADYDLLKRGTAPDQKSARKRAEAYIKGRAP